MKFNIWKFLAGLSFFLYGMFIFQISIKKIGSKYLKKFLKKWSATKLSGFFSGIITTALLQSSSVIALIIISFVGVGIISLSQAFSIIIGSNIGTTITAWLIAIFGFKISIQSLALPIIAIGGLLAIFFSKKRNVHYIGILIFGFGLLIFGIGYIKETFDFLVKGFDIASFKNISIFYYFVIGLIITALAQTTAISNTLALTGVSLGIFPFYSALYMVIGANVGTTSTALIGAISGDRKQKQVAFFHFFYNLITAIIIILILPFIYKFLYGILKLPTDVVGLASFHTFFNVIGALIFLPFVEKIKVIIEKILPQKEKYIGLYIEKIPPNFGQNSVVALEYDIFYFFQRAINFILFVFGISYPEFKKLSEKFSKGNIFKFDLEKKIYNFDFSNFDTEISALVSATKKTNLGLLKSNLGVLKKIEKKLWNYIVQLDSDELGKKDISYINNLSNSITNFVNSIYLISLVFGHVSDLQLVDKVYIQNLLLDLKKRIVKVLLLVDYFNKNSNLSEKKFISLFSFVDKEFMEFESLVHKKFSGLAVLKSKLQNMQVLLFIGNYSYQALKLVLEGLESIYFTVGSYKKIEDMKREFLSSSVILNSNEEKKNSFVDKIKNIKKNFSFSKIFVKLKDKSLKLFKKGKENIGD